ncbi:WD40-repeat-containing domain protein [Collybia nuda]|uniref:WD40-repeat-containing domain protein n=1 Tax=Collybia nuda TaxID=64659 RepID=A0A9P5Y9S2_9AGAR|nr:WD40-repeat-containing domain protein [Collybia nuda]
MAASDSEDDIIEDNEFEGDDDPDADAEEETLDVGADDATEEGDDESGSDESDDGSDDDDDDSEPSGEVSISLDPDVTPLPGPVANTNRGPSQPPSPVVAPQPIVRKRSLSPAQVRKKVLLSPIGSAHQKGSYTVEAVCAIPHPVPTHALASSFCMTHMLTGSDDGYIRNYDIFSAVNGKNFLTAPQRHHSGVVEGIMKSGQLRFWWENPALTDVSRLDVDGIPPGEEQNLSPVYSLTMHSDALWALAGTDAGHINLFTVRHEPGRLCYVMNGHRGPVSALSMDHDEKGFFSSGWDGEAIQWDLNTGKRVRNFTAHGAQLAGIAVRPEHADHPDPGSPVIYRTSATHENSPPPHLESATIDSTPKGLEENPEMNIKKESQIRLDSDAKSDASFDPLFDDEPQGSNVDDIISPVVPTPSRPQTHPAPHHRPTLNQILPPKNAPPLLDSASYATYSSDLLMTTAIDGQIILWDKRVQTPGKGVGRLWMSEKTPPWCLSACWSADGGQIYAGRRNGSVDVWDVRQLGRSGPANTPRLLKTLRNPLSSGVVSCVVAFPDCRHIACASIDNLRLWNVAEAAEHDTSGRMRSGAQFKIIPGHHGGYISQMLVDPGAKFLVSASSNRGWHGDSTRTVFVHDVKRSEA